MCDSTKSLSLVFVCVLVICSPSILLADTDAEVSVSVGQEFTIILDEIDGTYGFWHLASSLPSWLELVDETRIPDDPGVIGGPGTAYFTFQANGPGTTTLTFEYRYPGQSTALATLTCQVTAGTPADTEEVSVAVGEQFEIGLASTPGAGYGWYIAESLPSWLELVDTTWIADNPNVIGGPGTSHFTFRATGPGSTTLTFEYMRPWIGVPEQTHIVHVTVEPPADTEERYVAVGEEFTVGMKYYIDAYSWFLASSLPDWLELVGKEQVADPLPPGYVGGGGTEYWTFRATGPGSTTLIFEYRSYWETTPGKVHVCEVTAGAPTDPSLVLYLPFDEGAGAIANDLSSYHNPGAIVGATWVPGIRGTALEFVSGSNVTLAEIPSYDVIDAVSLLAWVKTTSSPLWGRVMDKSQYQTSGFDLCLTPTMGLPRLEFFVNNTTSAVDGKTAVIDDEWHFIAGTFGNKTLRMYVDGKKEAEAQSTGRVDINPNDQPIRIGGTAGSSTVQQYLGSIDEIAMYNRELSAAEVTTIFQNSMLSKCQPEVTSIRMVRLQAAGNLFTEVGEVNEVAVGDYFTIEVDVANRGSTPVRVMNLYGWAFSGQGHADVVEAQLMLCAALGDLQPGESTTVIPFCAGKAFQATVAGQVTTDITIGACHYTFSFEVQPQATPAACQPEVTDVRIVRLQPAGDHFEEVGEVSTVAVGDYFTIKVQVTNRGTTPVPRPLSYKATLSGQGDADVVGDYPRCLGLAMPPLQPGESVTLEPFCWGKAFQATTAGPVTIDIGIDTCHQPFRFEIQPQATPAACQPEVTDVRIVRLQPVGDFFDEIGEVSEVAVGDYFTIEIDVINRGNTPVTMTGQYQWSLSGQGHADFIDNFCIGVYWYDLQPGESTTLRPFLGCDALLATTAGPITMDMTVGENNCHYSFDFEIAP